MNYEMEGDGGDLRGVPEIFYTGKGGGDLKCFQNTEVRT